MINQERNSGGNHRQSSKHSMGNTINSTLSNNNNNNNNDTSTISQLDSSRLSLNPVASFIAKLRNKSTNSSFREEKKSYIMKKKFLTKNMQSAWESTQEIHSGWLKAQTGFKIWIKVWCQVKPGYLIIYTSQEAQKKHRLGVVMIAICQDIRRPSRKDGYCFKLINPFGCSIWAKSSSKALSFPQSSLTLRASDDSIGRVWLDSLQSCNLSSNLTCDQTRPSPGDSNNSRYNNCEMSDSEDGDSISRDLASLVLRDASNSTSFNNSVSSLRKNNNNNNFSNVKNRNHGTGTNLAITGQNKDYIDSATSQPGEGKRGSQALDENTDKSGQNSNKMVAKFCKYGWKELRLESVVYLNEGGEDLGSAGVQTEEVHESNKNFLWHIIKQLRPGMDLSKITLPTFILEPRSFLEKMADYYYHCNILSATISISDPSLRLIEVVRWYLSGFYKKPRGPKKPYNPILGERFRCFWDNPERQSRTFFVAEQVSHHPPITAFYVANKKDGYTINCSLLSRSKFNGISVTAFLDGKAKLHLTERDETYIMTLPYANCRGFYLGSLCLELGGKVEIACPETGCRCELDFKLAPVWANSNSYNTCSGKLFQHNKVTHTIDGHWDKKIYIVDRVTDKQSVLWEVTDDVRNSRLKRYTVDVNDQGDRESVKLWSKVTAALMSNDQVLATTEKTCLEEMQRKEARERQTPFEPKSFRFDQNTGEWLYKWQDNRAWDHGRDIMQFERDFKLKTLVIPRVSDAPPGYNPSTDFPLSELNNDIVADIENDDDDQAVPSSHVGGKPIDDSISALNRNGQKFKMCSQSTGLTISTGPNQQIRNSGAAIELMKSQDDKEALRLLNKKRKVLIAFASVLAILLALFFSHFV